MEKYFWDTKLDFLKTTRENMWNDDYFEFLVKAVWKLTKPVDIIDFGCGYGFLGTKLLPLLPQGSTYTGMDMGTELLNEAEKMFKGSQYKTEFIHMDLNQYIPHKQYDIAICQAVLRHIPASEQILQKMIDSVVPDGMVICLKINRNMENAGQYIHGIDYDDFTKTAELNKAWNDELQSGGRDYRFGIKVPIYMQKMGLRDVGVRINDFVDFISPLSDESDYKRRIDSVLETNELSGENSTKGEDVFALDIRSLIISFGTKK